MEQYKYIQVEHNQSVATVWLNRPQVHNALNGEMLRELIRCFKKLNRSDETRIIILRGKGPSFCSGADINWMNQSENSNYSSNNRLSQLLAACFQTIYKSAKPVVALLHGVVFGGGIGLLSACDIVIAAEKTMFSMPETHIGLVPSTILPYVLNRLNQHRAKVLIYSGQRINAVNAIEIGLIDFLFSENEVEVRTIALLNDLLKASPNALAEMKKLIRHCSNQPVNNKVVKKTIHMLTRVKTSKEGKEGLAAYKEKRSPSWVRQIK